MIVVIAGSAFNLLLLLLELWHKWYGSRMDFGHNNRALGVCVRVLRLLCISPMNPGLVAFRLQVHTLPS